MSKSYEASKKLVEDYKNFVQEREADDKLIQAIRAFAITDPYIYSKGDTLNTIYAP